jgi:hypothetical protein
VILAPLLHCEHGWVARSLLLGIVVAALSTVAFRRSDPGAVNGGTSYVNAVS